MYLKINEQQKNLLIDQWVVKGKVKLVILQKDDFYYIGYDVKEFIKNKFIFLDDCLVLDENFNEIS